MAYRRAVHLAAALIAVVATEIGVAPSAVRAKTEAQTLRTVALGRCWLQKLGKLPLGEDTNAHYYVTRWYAGAIQTLIQGTAPPSRYWSITLYHARRGKMVSLYDHQMAPGGAGKPFSIAVGGTRLASGARWADPTVGGGDARGYLAYRVYILAGRMPALPTVTFKVQNRVPSSLTSCSSMQAELLSTLTTAAKVQPATGPAAAAGHRLWPHSGPFRAWSTVLNPLLAVPVANVTAVSLVEQLADPNDVSRIIYFDLAWGDMVLRGRLPPISMQAPRTGMRYFSLCAYPIRYTSTLSCLDDASIKTDPARRYTVVVSKRRPSHTSNWLNAKGTTVGIVVMRWVLPYQGIQATFCLPALHYRPAGASTLPALPTQC